MKLTNLFLQFVDMSIAASYVVIAVVLLRLLLRRFPKWFHCALWAMVAVRMICPVALESPISIVTAEPAREAAGEFLDDYVGQTHTYWNVTEEYSIASDAGIPVYGGDGGGSYVVTGEKPTKEPDVLADVLSPVWLCGMVLLAGYAALSYWKLRKSVAASICLSDNLYLCDYIETPFILGTIKPKIYLPSSMDPNAASHVLSHERAHIRRRDHWWKPLGYGLLCMHWFNPLMWLAYILLCRDIEMACDEKVIRDMDVPDKKAYSEALLSCSVSRRMIAACPLAFGEVGVRQRIRSVLHYRKPAFWILLLAVVLCTVAAGMFLTDPVQKNAIHFAFDLDADSAAEFGMMSDYGSVVLSTDREREAVFELLDSIELTDEPLSGETVNGYVDEYGWAYPMLNLNYGEEDKYLYFSCEFDNVWMESEEGRTVPYGVKNPELIQSFFRKYSAVVFSSEINMEPFASEGTPWLWAQNITLDAVDSLRYWKKMDNGSFAGGYLSQVRFEELLEILRDVPQSAFSEGKLEGAYYTYSDLYSNRKGEEKSAVWIEDGANRMVVVLRVEKGTVQMIVCPRYEEAVQGYYKIKDIKVWEIEDNALKNYLLEMDIHAPDVSVFVGSKYSWERVPVTVAGEEVTITARIMKGWEYQVISPKEGAESYGIRCRPGDAEEGWLYFSFWPDGFELEEEDRYYQVVSSRDGVLVYSYPSQVYQDGNLDTREYQWSYMRLQNPMGDYVVVLEDAESWSGRYRDAIDAMSIITEEIFWGSEVSIENMTLKLPYLWVSEVVEDMGTGDPYGIRFQPPGMEGWIFLSCQPSPVSVVGTNLKTESVTYENGLTGVASYFDGSDVWSNIRLTGLPEDYLLLNEGADDWIPVYNREINKIMASAQISRRASKFSESPFLWMQSVKPEDIRTCLASLHEEAGYSHPIEGSELEEFVAIINAVEKFQVVAKRPEGQEDPLWRTDQTNIHLYLDEEVFLLLRYVDDTVILTAETGSGIWETDGYWTIENEALKLWLKNLSYGGTYMLSEENREEVRQLLKMNFVEFFDPQMMEDMLFVGCKYDHERGLGVACFRMNVEGGYDLQRVIRGSDVFRCESGESLYCCSYEDWQIFLVLNRSVTGIVEYMGNTVSKYPIDRHPAVFVKQYEEDVDVKFSFVYGTGGSNTMPMDRNGRIAE